MRPFVILGVADVVNPLGIEVGEIKQVGFAAGFPPTGRRANLGARRVAGQSVGMLR